MKKKLGFSFVLSLILIMALCSPVLAQENHDGGGNGDHDGGGGNGDHDGGGGHSNGDEGGEDDPILDEMEWAVEQLWLMDPPEGQQFGPVQNIRDANGDIIMTPEGNPLMGRRIFDANTGEPIRTYDNRREGEDLYITTAEQATTVPWNYFFELEPGFKSGPGYERFAYTPPPGYGYPDADEQTQDPPPPGYGYLDADEQTQDSPPPVSTSEPENQDGELPPSETFRDDTQFGEPQPVMGPTNNPLVDEDGAPILGRVVLDEGGNPVIGPNGKLIIVIPD